MLASGPQPWHHGPRVTAQPLPVPPGGSKCHPQPGWLLCGLTALRKKSQLFSPVSFSLLCAHAHFLPPSLPLLLPLASQDPQDTVPSSQRPWGTGSARGRVRGLQPPPGTESTPVTPPFAQTLLPGRWLGGLERCPGFKPESSWWQVGTTSRRAHWLLSPVSGQQRRPWDDRTNGSSWASGKYHGVKGFLHAPCPPETLTAACPAPTARTLALSENLHFYDRRSCQQPTGRHTGTSLHGDQVLNCVDHLLGCSKHIMSPIHYKAPCPMQWGGFTDECAMALSWRGDGGGGGGEGGGIKSKSYPTRRRRQLSQGTASGLKQIFPLLCFKKLIA